MNNQETNYVEPAIEVSGNDPLATQAAATESTTICGCCFC